MISGKKVVVVLPAYNAEKTLKDTCDEIPGDIVDDIILVDDASSDLTVEMAKKLNLKTIVHSDNKGYGANQKTCYREALKAGAESFFENLFCTCIRWRGFAPSSV